MKVTLKDRILAITLCIAMLVTTINLSDLFEHELHAATVNDKTLEDFMDEVSTLYEDTEVQEMSPDITFTKEAEDTVIVDDTIMVPVDVATENVDIEYSDIKRDIVKQDSQELIAVEDIAKNSDYEAVENNDDSITLSKIYQSKTLIVKSSVQIDTYDAETVISGWGDLYILKFSTEQDTKKAYEKLLKNEHIESVEIDSILSSETLNESEEISSTEEMETTIVEEDATKMEENTEDVETTESSKTETSTEDVETTENSETEIIEETVNIPEGVIVAIIDSGIDKSNTLFADRIIDLGLNLSTSGEGIQDDNGHGTAVASVIAKYSNANIMPIKIANSEGKGTALSLYLAIQAAIENKADIINISLTTGSSDLLTSVIAECEQKGITVIAAAGNQSANVENYAPANIESVITVAATDKEYNPASYSNYGELIDYAALGEMEVETLNGKTVMTGTSLSAAYVTAVIAKSIDEGNTYSDYVYSNGENIYFGNGVISLEEITLKDNSDIEIPETGEPEIEDDLDDDSEIELAAETINTVTSTSGTSTYVNGKYTYEFSYNIGATGTTSSNVNNICTVTRITIDSSSTNTYIPLDTAPKVKYSVNGSLKTFTLRPTGYGNGSNNVVVNNSNKALTSLRLNRYTKTIKDNAFNNLSSITSAGCYYTASGASSAALNNFVDLEYIGNSAFSNCKNLKRFGANANRINIPATCTTIGSNAFYNVGSSYAVGSGVTIINIGSTSDTTIRSSAFSNVTSAATVTIGTGVKNIGSYAFSGCPITTKLTWNAINCTTYNNAFTNKSIPSITIGSSVTHIPENFIKGNTAVTSIEIPDSVTTINTSAFYGCTALKTVTLGTGVTSIGSNAFYNALLTTLKIKSDIVNHNNVFMGHTGIQTLNIQSGCTTIYERMFYNCTSIKTLTLASSVNMIGNQAFYGVPSDCSITGKIKDLNGQDITLKYGDMLYAAEQELSSASSSWTIGGKTFNNIPITNWTRSSKNVTSKVKGTGWTWAKATSISSGQDITDPQKVWDASAIYHKAADADYLPADEVTGVKDGKLYHAASWACPEGEYSNDKIAMWRFQGTVKFDKTLNFEKRLGATDATIQTVIDDGNLYIDDDFFVFIYPKAIASLITDDTTSPYYFMNFYVTWGGWSNKSGTTLFHGKSAPKFNTTGGSSFAKLTMKGYCQATTNNAATAILNGYNLVKNDSNYDGTYIVDYFVGDYNGHGGAYRLKLGMSLKEEHTEHQHEYTSTITNATCTSSGTEIWTCACGDTITKTTSPLGHAYPSNYSYATNNGISNGMKYKNCTRCGIRLETQYLVSVSKGAGISSATNSYYTTQGSNVSLSATASTGYSFNGWTGYSTNGSFTMPSHAVAMTANAVAIYYNVQFNYNGGAAGPVNTAMGYAEANPHTGHTATETSGNLSYTTEFWLSDPTRTGHVFTGWTISNSDTSTRLFYNGNTSSWEANTNSSIKTHGSGYAGTYHTTGYRQMRSTSGTVVFTANWTANPNTAYKVNHYQMNVSGSGYTLKETENKTGTTGATVTPAVKSYTGFTSPSTQTVTIAADGNTVVNYYYTRNKYTVTLNKGTGTSSVSGGGSYYYGASVTINASLTTGYKWSKWSGTHNTTTQKYTFTMPSSNVTDTANATRITYTVTYNGNQNTGGSTASQTFNYGSSVKISANGFTKTDYEFVSWNTKADGSGTTYHSNQTYATNANITLYAQWKLAKVSIPVTINWDDENNNVEGLSTGVRPEKVTLKLMNGSTVVATATVTGNHSVPATSNVWNYKFEGLDKFDSNGNVITYKVVEEQPSCLDGSLKYEVSYSSDTYTIENVLKPKPVTEAYKVVGTITWLDENDKYHFRPDSIILELHQNGKKIKEIEIPEGTTTYEFAGLEKYDGSFKLYEYKVVERTVNNYSITYKAYETSVTETDSLGNKIITTTLHYDVTNTFTPNAETIRKSNNVLSLTPYVKNGNSNATDKDYLAACADKTENIFVTLKQMDMTWTTVDSKNGKYTETYKNTYSGIEFNMMLNIENTSTMTDIMCGKYEIVVADNKSFDFKEIKELAGKNATFSYENGKYYVTFSYAYEEASKDLEVNFTLDSFNGYESTHTIKNLYKLFLKKED